MRRSRIPSSPAELGYVLRASPVRDPYGLREYLNDSSPVGLTPNLQEAKFYPEGERREAADRAFWQHGFLVSAIRRGNRIETFNEPDPVKCLPRQEPRYNLGLRMY